MPVGKVVIRTSQRRTNYHETLVSGATPKHRGRYRPLLLLNTTRMISGPQASWRLLCCSAQRARTPQAFSPDPKHTGAAFAWTGVDHTTCYTQAVNRQKVAGRGEAKPPR